MIGLEDIKRCAFCSILSFAVCSKRLLPIRLAGGLTYLPQMQYWLIQLPGEALIEEL